MKKFKELREAVKHEWLYHGTSTVHADSISNNGLVPGHGKDRGDGNSEPRIYANSDPGIAAMEARVTAGRVGGDPHVVKIKRSAVHGWKQDSDWDARTSFYTTSPIAKEHVSSMTGAEHREHLKKYLAWRHSWKSRDERVYGKL